MITTETRKKIFSAMLCAACSLPLLAFAGQPGIEITSTTVSYGDLDISTSDGQELLQLRLHQEPAR